MLEIGVGAVDGGLTLLHDDLATIADIENQSATWTKDVEREFGLRLADIPAGLHPFVVLPMPLADADGAPCRAFVGLES